MLYRRLFRSPRILIAIFSFFAVVSLFILRVNDSGPGAFSISSRSSGESRSPLLKSLEESEMSRKRRLSATVSLPSSDDPERGCVMPKITEFNKVYSGYSDTSRTTVSCSRMQDWLIVEDGLIKLTDLALKKYCASKDVSIKCTISYFDRADDFHQKLVKESHLNSAVSSSIPLEHDFFNATCRTHTRRILQTTHTWRGLLAGIKQQPAPLTRPHPANKSHKLNILIFGFDSVSHVEFIKRLPKLYSLIVHDLDGIILDNYNIVGDGTTAALLAMLSGKYETELPETRRGRSKNFVDVYPWIWNKLKQEKYATLYAEDESEIGTFQYRLNGFRDKPTDHYMRPFQLRAEKDHSLHHKYCLGSQPKIDILTRYVDQFFAAYPPDVTKFAFAFHSEYSHGVVEELSLADEPITQWFTRLNESGILNDTVVMIMSDHGHRFSKSRATLQGKYEERMPFFSIVLPKWFNKVYPASYQALLINSLDRLTSPFDIHATIESLFDEMARGQDIGVRAHSPGESGLARGLSLFREIPVSRSCDHGNISPHWCACNDWRLVDSLEDNLAHKLAQELVNAINEAVIQSGKDGQCAHLSLASVKRAMKMQPKSAMLSFKVSSDNDGRVPDLTGQTEVSHHSFGNS